MKLSHRKMYTLPRSPEEIRINNYNPLLLMLWKANMDLQFVGESTLVIANYVTGYVTKAEHSNMQDLWQEVSSHTSLYSKLWSFGICSLRSRECGLYEASDIPLGDHLCEKSKTVKWVDVSQPHQRKRRLIDHSKLVEMQERNPDSPIFSKVTSLTRSILRDLMIWRTCACTTLLQSTSSAASMNTVIRSTAALTKPPFQITGFSIPKKRMNGRAITIPFSSSLFPSAMKRRVKMPNAHSIGTWQITVH